MYYLFQQRTYNPEGGEDWHTSEEFATSDEVYEFLLSRVDEIIAAHDEPPTAEEIKRYRLCVDLASQVGGELELLPGGEILKVAPIPEPRERTIIQPTA